MYVSHGPWLPAPRTLPAGQHVFAIGDVHGHADHLEATHQVLRCEIARSPGAAHHVVHLGDSVDRGPDPRRTLEIQAGDFGCEAEVIHLVGNHEQYLIELLRAGPDLDREFLCLWYEYGGIDTMRGLGVEGYGRLLDRDELAELSARTARALGPRLVGFLEGLRPMHRIGDYVFVHAGIDPAVPLEEQDFADLLMMREPFLGAGRAWSHPFTVVHGHTIASPAVYRHRIPVDAGCFTNGALVTVQLTGDHARFLAVTPAKDTDWLARLGGPARDWDWSAPEPV